MTRAPRIDTTRNRLAATRELLGDVEKEIEDLHTLAYDRQVAKDDVAVSGGQRDYALDTHGDPRARDAYRTLANTVSDVCDQLAEAAHDVIVLLREGDTPGHPRGRRRIDTEELAQQLEHQAVRIANGDYTPHRIRPQPEAAETRKVLDRVRRERDQARADVERLKAELARLGHTDVRTQNRWRSA